VVAEVGRSRPFLYEQLLTVTRHSGKNIDLSLTMRLSNLPNAAQLELVQGSRSPTVVSVALQLADQRMIQKFPSNVSLWQVLRVFETSEKLNFTERAVPSTTNHGAGRLFYDMPVLTFMNREFATLSDLQKTLGQIGLSGGSALLRLSFKTTQKPLEEAMKDISMYFKPEPEPEPEPETDENFKPVDAIRKLLQQDVEMKDVDSSLVEENAPAFVEDRTESQTQSILDANIPSPSIMTAASQTPNIETPLSIPILKKEPESLPTPPPQQVTSPMLPASESASTSTPLTIYSPATNPTPLAARTAFNEADYIPTMEHASSHQARLLTETRNKRLPSDKEIAARESEKSAAVAAVASVNVRVRCPDGSLVQMVLTKEEATGKKLYDNLRDVARESKGWVVKYTNPKGQFALVQDSALVNLITTLKWKGSILVYMLWEDGVSESVKKRPSLKDEAMSAAEDIKKAMPASTFQADPEEKSGSLLSGLGKALNKGKERLNSVDKEAKLKNLLGFGRKKK
jgi:tether containing UBX domain for GLUT4